MLRPALPGMAERLAAAGAARLGDEGGAGEADGAEPARRIDRPVAGQAHRRQQQIQRRPRHAEDATAHATTLSALPAWRQRRTA
jgi:hypothetical protein